MIVYFIIIFNFVMGKFMYIKVDDDEGDGVIVLIVVIVYCLLGTVFYNRLIRLILFLFYRLRS